MLPITPYPHIKKYHVGVEPTLVILQTTRPPRTYGTVPMEGLEPSRFSQQFLRLSCLPITPHRHIKSGRKDSNLRCFSCLDLQSSAIATLLPPPARGLNHIGSLPVYIGDITEPLPDNTGIIFSGALDLVCFMHDLICLLVGKIGLEPITRRASTYRSTN